jgi:RNA polymerase sigma factor (sigma-70 family)
VLVCPWRKPNGGERSEAAGVAERETCLAQLANRERMVGRLTFYAEKTGSEIGKELRLTEGNVRVIRHRAIERLRTCMMSRERLQ